MAWAQGVESDYNTSDVHVCPTCTDPVYVVESNYEVKDEAQNYVYADSVITSQAYAYDKSGVGHFDW
jgi:hypothetical protein